MPTFTAEVLRHRLVSVAAEDAEHPRLLSRNHTPLTTSDVRRRLRAGIEGVTPHSFRRTVATVLDRAGGADLAAELLSHSSPESLAPRRSADSGDGQWLRSVVGRDA